LVVVKDSNSEAFWLGRHRRFSGKTPLRYHAQWTASQSGVGTIPFGEEQPSAEF
jgi:hypothetical protein